MGAKDAGLNLQPDPARRRLAFGGQPFQLRIGLGDAGMDRARLFPLAKGADAVEGEIEGSGLDAGQLKVKLVGRGLVHLAKKAQGDVQIVAGRPLGARQALLPTQKRFGYVVRDGQGGEQADHALGSRKRAGANRPRP